MNNKSSIFERPYFEKFKDNYRSAKAILEKNAWYLELLTKSYDNKEEVNFIKKVNDLLEISPVYTWLKIHQQELENYQNKLGKGKKLEDNEQSQLRISIRRILGLVNAI